MTHEPPPTGDLPQLLRRGYGYAFALTADATAASDLVQQACERMLRARAPWEAGYLFRTVRTAFIDGLRRRDRLRFQRLEFDDNVGHEPADPASHPDPWSVDDERITEAMSHLPSAWREILWLHAVEGRSASDIAAEQNRPANTVKSHLHRAKCELRRRLADLNPYAPKESRDDNRATG